MYILTVAFLLLVTIYVCLAANYNWWDDRRERGPWFGGYGPFRQGFMGVRWDDGGFNSYSTHQRQRHKRALQTNTNTNRHSDMKTHDFDWSRAHGKSSHVMKPLHHLEAGQRNILDMVGVPSWHSSKQNGGSFKQPKPSRINKGSVPRVPSVSSNNHIPSSWNLGTGSPLVKLQNQKNISNSTTTFNMSAPFEQGRDISSLNINSEGTRQDTSSSSGRVSKQPPQMTFPNNPELFPLQLVNAIRKGDSRYAMMHPGLPFPSFFSSQIKKRPKTPSRRRLDPKQSISTNNDVIMHPRVVTDSVFARWVNGSKNTGMIHNKNHVTSSSLRSPHLIGNLSNKFVNDESKLIDLPPPIISENQDASSIQRGVSPLWNPRDHLNDQVHEISPKPLEEVTAVDQHALQQTKSTSGPSNNNLSLASHWSITTHKTNTHPSPKQRLSNRGIFSPFQSLDIHPVVPPLESFSSTGFQNTGPRSSVSSQLSPVRPPSGISANLKDIPRFPHDIQAIPVQSVLQQEFMRRSNNFIDNGANSHVQTRGHLQWGPSQSNEIRGPLFVVDHFWSPMADSGQQPRAIHSQNVGNIPDD